MWYININGKEVKNRVNERFKKLRKALGLTQSEFGKILGLSTSGVSEIEAGRRKVTEQHLIMLSNYKEKIINIEWLRTGTGEMFKQTTPYEEAYNRFGYIMENATPSKKAVLSMLLELLYTIPDKQWDIIMKEFEEIKKEG